MPQHISPGPPADVQQALPPGPLPLPPDAYKVLADVLGGNGRVVAYRPYFAHTFGGACNALLLSQLWFWANTPTVRGRAEGWFWKSQKEITAETGLTRTETGTARRKLCGLGVIEAAVRGVPPTVHFRVNREALFGLLWSHILANPREFEENLRAVAAVPMQPGEGQNPQIDLQVSCKLNGGKPANQAAGNPQTTETPSENTAREFRKTLNVGPAPSEREPAPEGGGGARTSNVSPAGQKTLSPKTFSPETLSPKTLLRRDESARLAQRAVALTQDEKSRRRYEQLAGLCRQYGALRLWETAYTVTEARMTKSSSPPATPGAYFCGVLKALFQDEGLYMPVGTPAERADIRAQIAQSFAQADQSFAQADEAGRRAG